MEDLLLWLFLKFLMTNRKRGGGGCVCMGIKAAKAWRVSQSPPPLFHILLPLNLTALLRPSKKPEEMFLNAVLREYMTGLTNSIQAKENAPALVGMLGMALVTGTTACSQFSLLQTVLPPILSYSQSPFLLSIGKSLLILFKYTNTVPAEINFISKILDSDIQIK